MDEIPLHLQSGNLVSGSDSVPTLIQTIATLSSDHQRREQSHGQGVVGELRPLQEPATTVGGSLLDSGMSVRDRGHLDTLGETLSSQPAYCDAVDQQKQVISHHSHLCFTNSILNSAHHY